MAHDPHGTSLLDSGAAISMFSKTMPIWRERRAEMRIQVAGGGEVTLHRLGFNPVWGWGWISGDTISLISQSAILDKFNVFFNNDENMYTLCERAGPMMFHAYARNGVYAIDTGETTDELLSAQTVTAALALGRKLRAAVHNLGQAERAKLLHATLGHCSAQRLKNMIREGALSAWDLTAHDIEEADLEHCHGCSLGKDSIIHHEQRPTTLPTHVASDLHCDIFHGVDQYYLFCVEAVTNFIVAVPIADRSEDTLCEAMLQARDYFRNLEWAGPKRFWWDNEAGAVSGAQQLLDEHGITLHFAAAEQSEKRAEAMTKAVKNAMRATAYGLAYAFPESYTRPLFRYVVSALNHLTVDSSGKGLSRWALIHRTADNGALLQVPFGTLVYVEESRRKKPQGYAMMPRQRLAIVVGREDNTRNLLVQSVAEGKGLLRRTDFKLAALTPQTLRLADEWSRRAGSLEPDLIQIEEEKEEEDPPAENEGAERPEEAIDPMDEEVATTGAPTTDPRAVPDTASGRSRRTPVPTDRYLNFLESVKGTGSYSVTLVAPALQPQPRGGLEPTAEELAELRWKAGLDEAKQMHLYEVIIPLDPDDPCIKREPLIPVTVVYAIKRESDGTFIKVKVRFCARGDMQPHDPWLESSSPVIGFSTLLLIFNKCVSTTFADPDDHGITIVDITAAYLEARLRERVLVKFNEEVTALLVATKPELERFRRRDGSMVVELQRCLYGLRQSGREWYNLLSSKLIAYGLKRSDNDPALFTQGEGPTLLIVGVYVDDITVCGARALREEFTNYLKGQFKGVKIQPNPDKFALLGMACAFQEDRSLFVSLPLLEDELVQELGEEHGRAAKTPYRPKTSRDPEEDTPLTPAEHARFRSLVAKALYLAMRTRPDILTAVSLLTTKVAASTQGDWLSLTYVGKYLRGTRGYGIVVSPSDLQLRASADASYMLHADSKGHTGFCIWLGEDNSSVVAHSGKQKLNAGGSMEAELISLASCSKSVTLMRSLCEDLECKQLGPVTIEQDNMSLLACFKRGYYQATTKHIAMRFQHVKEQLENDVVKPVYVPSLQVKADHLTKPATLGHEPWTQRMLNRPQH